MDGELFEEKKGRSADFEPLAFRMKPRTFDEFVGQSHILGPGMALRRLIEADSFSSLIFFGPPGCGKTALAFLIARMTKKHFVSLNAITATVADLRRIIEVAGLKRQGGERTVLFIDEIAHFNKLQQDALMPEIENGTIILIGATTYNPFFSVNRPLVSRSIVFEFKKLEKDQIMRIIDMALCDSERGLGRFNVKIDSGVKDYIAKFSSGDARVALNILEVAVSVGTRQKDGSILIDIASVQQITQKKYLGYDRQDEHYHTISAFIKSIRGSDPDAALYWLAKMLVGGEDPAFIARRILIAASEDIGNADPMAIVVAASALQAVEYVGMPEARICLAQATIYLATAPKSNASYLAIEKAVGEIKKEMTQDVPDHLKSTGYSGAEILGYGKGYLYPHDFNQHFVSQPYTRKKVSFYIPSDSGYERRIKIFLQRIEALKRQKKQEKPNEGGNQKKNS
ncbi:MAG: replication-associated recombination protein A [Candidatus Omnitrophica bacterium]|nr:replication-associated recombination protein A [Candidatus Omnitrophota bacterium]MCM8829209.1 replication-associated recombination protein A [Candidatus Omnitrophota bacterium]